MTTKLPPGAPTLTWKSDTGETNETAPGETLSDSSAAEPEDTAQENLSKIAKGRKKNA